jgi:protein-S-isoprenylcysteine O-methyltransferase Ste14
MPVYHWIIAALWLVLIVTWAVAAAGAKRSIGGPRWRRQVGGRLAVLILVLLSLRFAIVRRALRGARAYAVNHSLLLGALGVVVCALGIGLALWARVHLGRNWGMPMTRKENPELVTSGPYALARHPIYGGVMLAMLGSALAQSFFWLLPLVLFSLYFIYSARREETLMSEQFPQAYSAYRRRTKMFIPYVV